MSNPFEEETDAAAQDAFAQGEEAVSDLKRSGGDVELKRSGGDVEFSGGDVEFDGDGDGEEGGDSGGDVESEPDGNGN